MADALSSRLLVTIPHAAIACPPEIAPSMLSAHQQMLALNNVDWYTEHLYSFQDLLGNSQALFPYSQVYINVNRHPDMLDESIPTSLDGLPIYATDSVLSWEQRQSMLERHLQFHRKIASCHKVFILDGHSTITGHQDAKGNEVSDDIILSDWQASALDAPGGIRTAPPGFLDTYAEELERRLAGLSIRIAKNTTYTATYGHIMATHGWDGRSDRGSRAPLLLQETNENLYVTNGMPNVRSIEELRRAFADSLAAMLTKMRPDLL